MPETNFKTIDEYIASFPNDIQVVLQQIRHAVRESAPQAEETISYKMPAFRQNGILVYFAAFKDHIGFFPTALGVEEFADKLKRYKTSKGTVQFPLNQPMPIELIKEIVSYRILQNQKKTIIF